LLVSSRDSSGAAAIARRASTSDRHHQGGRRWAIGVTQKERLLAVVSAGYLARLLMSFVMKGLSADSEKKHEPVSDIDTAAADRRRSSPDPTNVISVRVVAFHDLVLIGNDIAKITARRRG
jgi:hypothetical protein